jgi:hypothetical protein
MAAYLGSAHTLASPVTISQPTLMNSLTFERVRFESRSFNPPLYYGGRAGYFIPGSPSLGIEAEFIHLKVFSNPLRQVHVTGIYKGTPIDKELPLGEIVQRYSVSHGVNLLLFNVAVRRGVGRIRDAPNGRLVLTGRVGAGPTLPHTESTVDGRQQEQYELGRMGWPVVPSSTCGRACVSWANTNSHGPANMGKSFPARRNHSCARTTSCLA